jgi:hypothetical protein
VSDESDDTDEYPDGSGAGAARTDTRGASNENKTVLLFFILLIRAFGNANYELIPTKTPAFSAPYCSQTRELMMMMRDNCISGGMTRVPPLFNIHRPAHIISSTSSCVSSP